MSRPRPRQDGYAHRTRPQALVNGLRAARLDDDRRHARGMREHREAIGHDQDPSALELDCNDVVRLIGVWLDDARGQRHAARAPSAAPRMNRSAQGCLAPSAPTIHLLDQ